MSDYSSAELSKRPFCHILREKLMGLISIYALAYCQLDSSIGFLSERRSSVFWHHHEYVLLLQDNICRPFFHPLGETFASCGIRKNDQRKFDFWPHLLHFFEDVIRLCIPEMTAEHFCQRRKFISHKRLWCFSEELEFVRFSQKSFAHISLCLTIRRWGHYASLWQKDFNGSFWNIYFISHFENNLITVRTNDFNKSWPISIFKLSRLWKFPVTVLFEIDLEPHSPTLLMTHKGFYNFDKRICSCFG